MPRAVRNMRGRVLVRFTLGAQFAPVLDLAIAGAVKADRTTAGRQAIATRKPAHQTIPQRGDRAQPCSTADASRAIGPESTVRVCASTGARNAEGAK